MQRTALLILAVCTLSTPALAQTSDVPQDPSVVNGARFGTASISGVVLNGDSGRPILGVRVSAASSNLGVRSPMAKTDENGRFILAELPSGRYFLNASMPGYLTVNYGQRRPLRPGRAVEIRGGERVQNIDFRLPRTSAITGRVLDAEGDPLVYSSVRALRSQIVRGEPRAREAGIASTDDRGVYRIQGLPPGNYYVSATSPPVDFERNRTAPEDGVAEVATAAFTYGSGYYPGVSSMAEALLIPVPLSNDVAGVDFTLPLVRSAVVTGTVAGIAGGSRNSQVFLVPEATQGTSGVMSTRTDEDGAFSIRNVPVGRYTAAAYVFSEGAGTEPMYGLRSLTVSAGTNAGVTIAVRPRFTITGSITFEGSTPPRAGDIRRMRIALSSLAKVNLPGTQSVLDALPRADGTFTISDFGIDGSYSASLSGIPAPWWLKAIYLDGRDVADSPFELQQGQAAAQMNIVLTDRGPELSGTVRDDQNVVLQEGTVVAFPADEQMWRAPHRRIVATRTDKNGAYTFPGLPPGDYLVVASDDVMQDEWYDPAMLATLRKTAERVVLREGEKKSLDLKAHS